MSKKISIQLYTLREECKTDFPGTIRRLAEIGYAGVEPHTIYGDSAEEMHTIITDYGLTVSGYQGGLAVDDDAQRLLDETQALETSRLICPCIMKDAWSDMAGLEDLAGRFRRAVDNATPRNIQIGHHNHDWEMTVVDGTPALLRLAEKVPQMYFTLDTYWVKVGGQDPVEVVKALGSQANLLHIKDGPGVKGEPMVAAGDGVMDFPPIVEAADGCDWLVVELDKCATDMFQAVEKSYRYLTETGLGEGKN